MSDVHNVAARELRNYANVLCNLGSATPQYIASILATATALDGQQPDSRFADVPNRIQMSGNRHAPPL